MSTTGLEIAIIGYALRLPGARTPQEYWRNSLNGTISIRHFSDDELRASGIADSDLSHPDYVRARGIVDGAAEFDSEFFNYSAAEAAEIDPQQRTFLEICHEALESTGYDPLQYAAPIGVFAGCGTNTYLLNNLLDGPVSDSTEFFRLVLGNDKDFLATRVAYKLKLSGPAVGVQTACSTSLAATHLACRSLLAGECGIALAGGVSIGVPQESGYWFSPGGKGSKDGLCRPFDSRADGIVASNGAAVVVLKRLEDALKDRDQIQSVILASAVNNDGANKVGYTAPSVDGQAAVIRDALHLAGVSADSIGYIEAHGTGTPLGDPIEAEALTKAFRATTDRNGFCVLGSAKANIGHTDAAAGSAGLIRASLAIKHGVVPPLANLSSPNSTIDFASSPFYLIDRPKSWGGEGQPRRAGVSSLGIGGTNVHVVLEQAPVHASHSEETSLLPHVLIWSARTHDGLRQMTENLATFLETTHETFADVAWTAQIGRRPYEHRCALVASNKAAALAAIEQQRFDSALCAEKHPAVQFHFGDVAEVSFAHFAELYVEESVLRSAYRECAAYSHGVLPEILDPNIIMASRKAYASDKVARIKVFAMQFALAKLWGYWGIAPSSVSGAGQGEFVAAVVAGMMPLSAAVEIVMIAQRAYATADDKARAVASTESILERSNLRDPEVPFFGDLTSDLSNRVISPLEVWRERGRRLIFGSAPDANIPRVAGNKVLLMDVHENLVLSEDSSYGVSQSTNLDRTGHSARECMLSAVSRLWLQGCAVDWTTVSQGPHQRVSLPGYPLNRRTCWIEPKQKTAALPRNSYPEWFYAPTWKRSRPLASPRSAGLWIIFADETGIGDELAEIGRLQGARVVTVRIGEGASSPECYFVRSSSEGDFDRFFSEHRVRADACIRVVYLWGFTQAVSRDSHNVADLEDRYFNNLIHLGRSLSKEGFAADVLIVCSGLAQVLGGDLIHPEKSLAIGIARVMSQENAAIRAKCVDIDFQGDAETAATVLAAECEYGFSDAVVAYRSRERWVESWERLEGSPHQQETLIRDGGVYLITGGLGFLGLRFAEHLSRRRGVRLALLSRSLPGAAKPLDPRHLAAIAALEKSGAETVVFTADVGNLDQLTASIHEIESRFGPINGVIHAAGAAGGRLISNSLREVSETVLRPKVVGTRNLDQALSHRDLDFLLLCSSLTSYLGGAGQSAYCAANSYLDAYARWLRARGKNAISVNWDSWREGGMAAEAKVASSLSEFKVQNLHLGLSTREGLKALDFVLSAGVANVAVSTLDLELRGRLFRKEHQRFLQGSSLEDSSAKVTYSSPKVVRQNRPSLSVAYRPARDTVERILVDIWEQVLGTHPVGVDDDFFELGAHSLLAVQALSRLRSETGVNVPVELIFERSTVALLAEVVRDVSPANS